MKFTKSMMAIFLIGSSSFLTPATDASNVRLCPGRATTRGINGGASYICGTVLWRCNDCNTMGCLNDDCSRQNFPNGRCNACGSFNRSIIN
jgi:hypothetical protein